MARGPVSGEGPDRQWWIGYFAPDKVTAMVDSRTVDWNKFPDVYGDTESIPAALTGIRSKAARTRRRAYSELTDLVVTQGSRCEASAVVAGLLIDIVADPTAPDRLSAMRVLLDIAVGDEEFWSTRVPDPAAHRTEINRKLASTDAELEKERLLWIAAATDDEERRARQITADFEDVRDGVLMEATDMAAYDAVRAGVPVFVEALNATEPPLRIRAAHLLSWFPEESAQIIPALIRVIAGDPDDSVAATASVAAGRCVSQHTSRGVSQRTSEGVSKDVSQGVSGGGVSRQDDEALIEALIRALRTRADAENPTERWSAMIGLAFVMPRPDRTVLAEVYHCMLDAPGSVPGWPFFAGDISAMAASALAALDPELAAERAEILVPRLLAAPRGAERFTVLGALLEAVCRDGVSSPATLTTPQRTAISAILQSGIADGGPLARQILGYYHLPADTRTLQTWLNPD